MKEKGVFTFQASDGRVLSLRSLRRSDLSALLAFANRIADERKRNADLGIVSLDRRMTRADESRFLNNTIRGVKGRTAVSIAAFHCGKIVGNCDIFRRTFRDVRHSGVLGIVILDGYRGIGLGERMIRAALNHASEMGVWLVELTVFSTNARARRLYRKVGFKEAGVVPKKILRNGRLIDEIVMYIHLAHSEDA